jgi:hypothetical protein
MATTNGYSLSGISDEDLQLIFDYRLPKAVQMSEPFHFSINDYSISDVRRLDQIRPDEHAVFVRITIRFGLYDGDFTYYFRVNDGKERSNPDTQTNERS